MSAQQIAKNKVVSFHYRLCEVSDNGEHSEWLEESFSKQPLMYLHGFNDVIAGLEKALLSKRIGDCVNITLAPEEAYGLVRPNSIQRVPIKHIRKRDKSKKLAPGNIVAVQTEHGLKEVIVAKVGKFNVDVDFNHPLAGRTLYYEVEVTDIRDATVEEMDHGHVHGTGGHHH